ncbi:MAG: DNA polymerase III subunit beta [Bacillota bacterium]|nr:DNA polymerase III subunit beta [Bacillota bacterium]
MKVRCSRNQLAPAVAHLGRIVPARTALPILNGLLVTAEEDRLILQSTDLELSLTIAVPAQVEIQGKTVVLTRPFDNLVRRLPEGELNLVWSEINQQVEICYNQGRTFINTWPASDYPSLLQNPAGEGIIIEGSKWKNIIKKVLFAAAPQEVRPQFAGVYFQLKEECLTLVATDTYRLALFQLPFPGSRTADLFIPVRALGEVNRLLEDKEQLEISWEQNMISFQTPRFTLTTRLLESQFPAYEKVIPEKDELSVEVERAKLISALERASLFIAPPETYAVAELKVEAASIQLTAQALQVGSLSEEIPLKSAPAGEGQASFNAHFLLEPLRVMESREITLSLNGSQGPAICREEDGGSYLHLVLPVCRTSDGVP